MPLLLNKKTEILQKYMKIDLAVFGLHLDLMIWKAFSDLNDSMILWKLR